MIKLRGPQGIDCLEMKNQDNAHQQLMSLNFRKKAQQGSKKRQLY